MTRRAFVAGATAASLAGCLGGTGGGGSAGETDCDLSPRDPVQSMPAPSIGPDDAAVTILTFEDFSCPHCQTYHLEEFPDIEAELVGDDVRYEHHDFPIPVSKEWSWQVASAARAVADSADPTTFFDYVHTLFENQGSYSMSLIESLAEDAGADGCDARAAATNERYRPVLEADRQTGLDMGIAGTPGVFVNGTSVEPTFEAVRDAVENAQS